MDITAGGAAVGSTSARPCTGTTVLVLY